jgi:hypothetical protein
MTFNYVIPDKLALAPRPGRFNDLESDLQEIQEEGFNLILSIYDFDKPEEVEFSRANLHKYGITQMTMNIKDFGVPSIHNLETTLKSLEPLITDRYYKILVHCGMSMGRAPLVVACLFKKLRPALSGEEAVALLRERYMKSAIETEEQEQFVINYCNSFDPETLILYKNILL